jgi:hypothetical protein
MFAKHDVHVGVVIGALAAAISLTAKRAEAYCRSTTCISDCPLDERGCKASGAKLAWTSGCVGFSLHEAASEHIPMKYFRQTAHRSFYTWTDRGCSSEGFSSISFVEQEESSCLRAEYVQGGPNANVIMFQDHKWTYTDATNNVAKTTVTFDDDTGEILDADIEINHANNYFTISDLAIACDLESVITHEIGHMIGLDHSEDPDATMFAFYACGDPMEEPDPALVAQRTLEMDDLAALCEAYPPNRGAACDPTPEGGLATECSGEPQEVGGGGGCALAAGPRGSGGPTALLSFAAALSASCSYRRRRAALRPPRGLAPDRPSTRRASS